MNIVEEKAKLKWNFLKTTIFRLDFERIDEEEFAISLREVAPYVKGLGFERDFVKTNNDIEVKLPSGEKDVTSEIRNRYKIYCFVNDTSGVSIELSASAILLVVNSSAYIPFKDYYSIFTKLLSILSLHAKVIIPKRVGLRKINKCLLNSLATLSTVIRKDVFSVPSWTDEQFPLNCVNSDSIEIKELKANITRQLLPGKIEEEIWYQLVIDTDAYCDSSEAIDSGLKGDLCSKLNDLLFELYIKALNPSFVKKLMNDDFSDNSVLGVEPNG